MLGLLLAGHAAAASLDVDGAKSRLTVDAKATGHTFSGRVEKFTAKVNGDVATMAPQAVDLSWDFADLKTGEGDRDKKMLEWLEHGKTPKGSFRMTKAWTDKQGKTWLQGDLSIHGVKKSLAFPYTVKKDGKRVAIDGSVWIDHQNFGLPIIKSMVVMTVDPKLKIGFHLEGEVK